MSDYHSKTFQKLHINSDMSVVCVVFWNDFVCFFPALSIVGTSHGDTSISERGFRISYLPARYRGPGGIWVEVPRYRVVVVP